MKINKKGISLIVLIIMIIIVIILAAAVILTISKNNLLLSAKEATFKSDIRNFQDELSIYIGNQVLMDYNGTREKITTSENSKIDEMKNYISSFTKKYEEKLGIEYDELVYFPDKVTTDEKKWLDDLGIKPAGSFIPEASEECFKWSGDAITGYYHDKLKVYLEKTNGVLKVPKRCTAIKESGIKYLQELKQLYIPNKVEEIGYQSVFGCFNLSQIIVSEGNEKYCSVDGVLYNKKRKELIVAPYTIEHCNVPDWCERIGQYSFWERNKLKEVTLPQNLELIDTYAFKDTNLGGTIVLPDDLRKIGLYAFVGTNIEKFIVGSNFEKIDDNHVYNPFFIGSLKKIEVNSNNRYLSSEDGILYNKEKTELIIIPRRKVIDHLVIPNSVKKIYPFACSYLNIKELTLNDGLEIIGNGAFFDCANLSNDVLIPSNVKEVGENIFYGCNNMSKIKCMAASKPDNWNENWNSGCNAEIVWNYTGK